MLFIVKTDVGGAVPLSPDRVFTDLFWITDQDFALGTSQELYVDQVTYPAQNKVNTFSTVVYQLVSAASNVSIAGLSTSQGAPTGAQATVLNNDGSIYILYDADACGFQGWYTFDATGQQICAPPPVALYHELVHASRHLNGSHNPDKTQEEKDAIFAENALRSDRGLPLRGIDSWNTPGGCGAANCGSEKGSGSTLSCFVVKATLGSGYESLISSLRNERNLWAARDERFARLLLHLYPEYYAIGLPLARSLHGAAEDLGVLREFLVEPYLLVWHFMYRLSNGWYTNPATVIAELRSALAVSRLPTRATIAAELHGPPSRTIAPIVTPSDMRIAVIRRCLASQDWDRFPVFRWAVLDLLGLVYSEAASRLACGEFNCPSVAQPQLVDDFRQRALAWAKSSPLDDGRSFALDIWRRLSI